jgi:glycosyltransferase involved in cell wall biosynthesis
MVYSGSISHVRRVPDLIAALPSLPDVHLVIVSVPFPHRLAPEFEEQADALGVRDRMHIVPPVSGRQVVSYLSTASVGVHPLLPGAPNHEMALPNKLFEYLHAGIPVVVSDCRAMTAFVHEVDLGLEFEHGSVESLATAVRTVIDGRAEGGFTPSRDVVERYTWEAQESLLASAYTAMLASPSPVETSTP